MNTVIGAETTAKVRGGVKLVAVAGAIAVLAGACGSESSEAAAEGVPTIAATTGIWADVVANVTCGDLVDIETIVPDGADPHLFEPSLADRERLDVAALIVANGAGLEEALNDTIEAAESAGTPVFTIADHVELLNAEDEEHEAEADGHDHAEGADPHIWFDPIRVSGALDALAASLVEHAQLDAAIVAACVERYRAELEAIDAEIVELVAGIDEDARKLVTNHDSLSYFATRYRFEIIGTVVPSTTTLAEANPADLEELAQAIADNGVAAIFVEDQHGSDTADALADRVGDVEVVPLPTGGLGEPDSGADTYIGFLRTNASLIAEALHRDR